MFAVVPETSLQANNGVDLDLLMDGYKVSVERNGGTFPVSFPLKHRTKLSVIQEKTCPRTLLEVSSKELLQLPWPPLILP